MITGESVGQCSRGLEGKVMVIDSQYHSAGISLYLVDSLDKGMRSFGNLLTSAYAGSEP